jgi:cell wall-associated NlpC family hydrolase
MKPGDLIFSPNHVCIYYGSGRIIHSSARAGGVYIENLMPDLPNARVDIFNEIELVRRMLL